MTREQAIEEALTRDTELSEEEYRAKTMTADETTAKHGVEGKAPISEKKRHDRIEMNFYGTCINILLSIANAVEEQNAMIAALLKKE